MNHKAVGRTALATPGLLKNINIYLYIYNTLLVEIVFSFFCCCKYQDNLRSQVDSQMWFFVYFSNAENTYQIWEGMRKHLIKS